MLRAGQIYLAKNAQLGKSNYRRPCLVLRIFSSGAVVGYLSTKLDLMEYGDFLPNESDCDFPTTGLNHTSYLMTDREIPVDADFFSDAKLLGFISGDMKKRVENWWGEAIV